MKDLILFFKQFFQNKGLLIFSSIFISKFVMLVYTIFIVKMISESEFGKITLIAAVFGFFVPLNGFGSTQILMKFGSQSSDSITKENLGQYLFRKGLMNQLLLCVLFFAACQFYSLKFENLFYIISLFTIRLLGFYFLGHIQADYRIKGNNKKFAEINIVTNLIMLGVTLVLTLAFGAMGYVIALALGPYLSLFYFKKSHFTYNTSVLNNFNIKSLWAYGRMESVAYFLSELMFSLDVILIALFLADEEIAIYKVAMILPMNLMILPVIFFQTDFPKIAKNATDKVFLKFYILNYYRIFIPFGIIAVLISYFFCSEILTLFFKKGYIEGSSVFFIATVGVILAMLSRILFINLTSAVGKSKWNVWVSVFSLFCLIVLNLILIPRYQMNGAALSMMITMIASGIFSMILFMKYYNHLKISNE